MIWDMNSSEVIKELNMTSKKQVEKEVSTYPAQISEYRPWS